MLVEIGLAGNEPASGPTTIGDMIWGVPFLRDGLGVGYIEAIDRATMVPLGWVIGCPLLGWISDSTGLRKPTLSGGIALMLASFAALILAPDTIPPAVSALIFGIASGAAMIPYTIIKEANPEPVKGSATGGQNFVTFSVTAVLGPWFAGWYGKTLHTTSDPAGHFRSAGIFFLIAMAVALAVSLAIRETGHKKKVA